MRLPVVHASHLLRVGLRTERRAVGPGSRYKAGQKAYGDMDRECRLKAIVAKRPGPPP